jgi:hypothetical protein
MTPQQPARRARGLQRTLPAPSLRCGWPAVRGACRFRRAGRRRTFPHKLCIDSSAARASVTHCFSVLLARIACGSSIQRTGTGRCTIRCVARRARDPPSQRTQIFDVRRRVRCRQQPACGVVTRRAFMRRRWSVRAHRDRDNRRHGVQPVRLVTAQPYCRSNIEQMHALTGRVQRVRGLVQRRQRSARCACVVQPFTYLSATAPANSRLHA